MNNIYKVVFNKATQTFTAVSELAKSKTKTHSSTTNKPQVQAGRSSFKFAKMTLSVLIALGLSTSSIATTLTPEELKQQIDDLKAQVEKLEKQKNYFHVNSANYNQSGTDDNADVINGIGGAKGAYSVTAGVDAQAISQDSVALGHNAKAADTYAVAIGHGAQALGHRSIAIGDDAITGVGLQSTAVGHGARATGLESTAFGNYSHALGEQALAIGNDVFAGGIYSIAMGTRWIGSNDPEGHEGGEGERTTTDGNFAIAIGSGYDRNSQNQIAESDGDYGIALGTSARTEKAGVAGVAIGRFSSVDKLGGVAIGSRSAAHRAAMSTASLGVDANATVDTNKVYASKGISDIDKEAILSTVKGELGAVSVGSQDRTFKLRDKFDQDGNVIEEGKTFTIKGATRQIINVAAGSEDSDAVNVAQLKAAFNAVGTAKNYFHVNKTENTQTGNESNEAFVDGIGGAKGGLAIAGGVNAQATGDSSVAFGYDADAIGSNAIAIGREAYAYGTHSSTTEVDGTVALGHKAQAKVGGNVAIGTEAVAEELRSTAIGYGTRATGQMSTALGQNAHATSTESLALGSFTHATGAQTIAVGNDLFAEGTQSIVIGTRHIGSSSPDNGLNGEGKDTATNGAFAIAIGSGAGRGSDVQLAESDADYGIALGTSSRTEARARAGVAIGLLSSAESSGGVALGRDSIANRNAISGKKTSTEAQASAGAVYANEAATGDDKSDILKTVQGRLGAVSVGTGDREFAERDYKEGEETKAGEKHAISKGTRQIINVAAGSEDSDAVNVAQLKAVAHTAEKHTEVKNGTNVADVVKTTGTDGHDIYTVNVEGTKVAGSTDVVVSSTADAATNDTTYNVDLSAGIKAEIANKSVEKVAAGTGIKVTSTADDDKTYTVELDQTAKTQLAKEESVVSTNNNVAITHATTNSTGGLEYALTLASNLTGITSIGNAPNGGKIILGETDKNISVNGGKLTNVKQGTENTDAVNVKQLKDYVTSTAKPTAVTVNEGTEANSNDYNTTGNLQIKETTANGGKPTYDIKLADKVTLGTADNQIVIDGTTGNITAGGVAIDGAANTVKGLSNTTFDPNATYTGGQAATQEQLKVVSDVAADKSIEEVVGTNGIAVTSSTGETDKTYTVGLDTATQTKVDNALQSIKTEINGQTVVQTLDKDNNIAKFNEGKNIVLTNNNGSIQVATANDLKGLTSVVLGNALGNDTVSLTTGGINAGQKVITNVATGVNGTDAVNVAQLTDTVNKSKVEVKNGTNVADVVKTTGTDGHDIYTVNVEGTKVAGSTDVVVSSTADVATNDTTYNVDLSAGIKAEIANKSVEKVAAGTGIKVTSTADDDKTYTVELDQTAKTQLAKEESVVSTNNNVAITHATTNSTGGLEYALTLASNLTGITSIGNAPNGGKIILGETDKNISVNGGKLTNVKQGTENTDAVNVKQLKDYVTSTAKPTAVTVNEGTEANSNDYNTTGNLQIKETTANGGKPTYDIKLADKVTLGTADNQIVIDGTTGNITAGGVAIDGAANTVKGLSNTTFDPNATYTGGQAATQEQLKVVSDVAADKSIEEVVGTNGIAVTSSTGETDKTYTVGLDTATQTKVDNALQSIKTEINGQTVVQTLDKDNNIAKFNEGKNIVLTNNNGSIQVATANDLKGLTSVVLGNALGNDTVSLTTGGINAGQKVITNVATGVNGTDAVNVAQLTDTVNKSKVEVKNGTNVADVVKTTGTDGHDIYTVNVEGTKVAGSTDVVVSSTADAATNDTTYNVDLSAGIKAEIANKSVEKVAAGTGIKVTSTADDDKTYTVELDQTAKTQLAKEESVVSTNNNVAITHATTNSTGGLEYALTLASNLTGITSIGNAPNGGKIILGETDKNISVNGGKLTNVKQGTENTDAVNVKQLKDYVTSTAKPTAVTVNEGTEANSNDYNTTGNLQIKETTANGGKPTYDIKLADKVTLGTADNQIVIDGTTGNITAGGVAIDGAANTVKGLSNTTFDPNATYTGGQAATQEQLKVVSDVAADKSIEEVVGTNGIAVTSSTGETDKTYTVGLDTATQTKVDNALQSIKTEINGQTVVQTLDKDNNIAKFNEGKNIVLTNNNGSIQVATANDLKGLTSVVLGNALGNDTVSLTTGGINAGQKVITNVATGVNGTDAVNVAQLTDTVNKSKVEVKNGTNVADVVKTTGTDGHDIYTVNVEGTKVAGSTDVVVSSTADVATNDTTYNVDLSAGIKAEIANKSVEKVAAGTGIKVTSTADDDKTYTVELDQTAKTQLAKEESVVSTNNNVAITHATTNSTGGLEYALTLASNLTGITSIGNAPNGGKIILGETDKNISVNGGKLTNVKQGTENTDAVNVKQLKDYVTSTAKPTAVTVNEGTEANSNDYNTTGNLQIKETTANGGKPTYDIKLADKVTLGTADNQIVIDGTTGNITAGGVAIDGAANTVKGLSNTTFDPNATYTGGQAATQEQLKVVSDVAADKSIEEVVGTNGIAVTSSTGETDKTYTVGLDTATQTKVDNALQSIKTEINGQTVVQTLDKDNNIAKFNEGKNIVLTNNNGSIQVATANDLKGLTSVVLGNALGNDTVSLTTGGINAGQKVITNVATGVNGTDAVNVAQLTDTVNKSKVEVKNGTNVADVVKTTGTDGHDIYTVNVEGTKVAGSTDVVVSSTADAATNDTTYNVDLSAGIKAEIANKSVEKVAAGTGIKVTSTADDDKTYTVELDQTAKTQLAKEESVVSTNNNVAITHATTNSTGGLEYALTLASNLTGITSIGNAPNGGKIILGETDKNISVNGGKLTNVKQGTENTDAVNVKQLKDYVTSTAKPTAVTVNEGTEANSNAYNTTGNLQIKETTANGGKPTYDIKLADKVTLGTADNQIVIDGTAGNVTAGGVAIDGTAKTVKGLSNTTFDPNATYTGGQAATQEQLKAVSDVAADKSIEKVVGTNGIAVTSSTGETDKTYTVGLDTTTKNSIDSALQSIVTQIDGAEVKTLTKDNNNANFLTGKNIVLTNEGGGIKVATADNLKGLTSVILGDVAGDTVVSLTQNGINAGQKVIRNVATGVNGTDAVNVNQLESVVNTAATKAKTEVAGGTNVAGVVKTTGTDGHDIYTVNVEGTKVAGSTDVVVSSTTDATTNDTTYTVRLSDDFKTKAKDQSVEKVVAGTGIKVTSTAGDDKTYTVELDDLVKTQLAKEESVVAADTNVVISQTKTNRTGGKEFEIKLADTVTLGTGDNQVVIDGTKGKVTAGLVTVNGKEGTINGLTNKTFDKDNFVSGQAATEDQLSAVAKSLTTDIANKGLNFKGNEGSVHRALGTALTIEGEKGADATQHLNENSKTAADNLYVKAEGDKLEIKLSEDVKNLNSVVLGTDASDKDTVALTKDGINAGSKKVTHVADGTIANDSTDAVNGSQLFDVADSVKNNFGGNANVADDGTLTFTDIGGTGEDTIHDAIASLKKVTDLGVSIVTQIDGKDVKTLSKADNKANFVAGKNIALTAEKGAIKVSTKDDLEVNSIANVKGTKLSLGEGAITLATKKSNANPTGAVQIKNVAAGIADTDAVNVAQLKGVTKAIDNVASEMEDIKGGVSSAMAAALLPQAYLPGQSVVSLAGATYKKNTAVAVGLSTISDNGKWIIKGSLNTNSTGEVGGGIGAGYAW